MGLRGPKPTPTPLKLLQGETRPSRVNYNEPHPAPTKPRRPKDLTPSARRIWDHLIREMEPSGVLLGVDTSALRLCVEALDRYQREQSLLEIEGSVVPGARAGDLVRNPRHLIVRDNAKLAQSLLAQLGMNPSVRSSMKGPEAGAGVGGVGWLEDALPPRARRASGDVD